MKKGKKIILLALCAVLLVGGSVLGTMAALNATSDTVTNTFVAGKIFDDGDFKLYEHNLTWTGDTPSLGSTEVITNTNYKVIPNVNLPKDPTVSIDGNTVAVYVYVKIAKSADWASAGLSYGIDTTWTALPGYTDVYYKALDADSSAGTATTLNVLADQQVVVGNLDNDHVAAAADETLSFTAYVCQKAGYADAAAGWAANFVPAP